MFTYSDCSKLNANMNTKRSQFPVCPKRLSSYSTPMYHLILFEYWILVCTTITGGFLVSCFLFFASPDCRYRQVVIGLIYLYNKPPNFNYSWSDCTWTLTTRDSSLGLHVKKRRVNWIKMHQLGTILSTAYKLMPGTQKFMSQLVTLDRLDRS